MSTTLKPELAEVVRKIHALRKVTKTTGFITNRTVGEMLAKLSTDDLVEVGEALKLKPEDARHYGLNAGVRRYDSNGNLIRS